MKKFNNKNIIYLIILLIVSLAIIIFTYNNHFLYNDTIVRIESVKDEKSINEESKEVYYNQKLKGVILNGEDYLKSIELNNYATSSGVLDDYISVGDEVFIEHSDDGVNITNIKRDKYVVILLVLFIDLMLIIGRLKGLKTIISLIKKIRQL